MGLLPEARNAMLLDTYTIYVLKRRETKRQGDVEMKQLAVIAGVAVFLAGCSTLREDPQLRTAADLPVEAEQTTDYSQRNDPNEIICRRIKVTATNLPRRACHTRRQIEMMRDAAATTFRNIDRAQRSYGQND